MKGIVVYDTSYGNTKKIAETITETLRTSGIDIDLFFVEDVKKLTSTDYDFLVLGSPTKVGTMSLSMKFFFGKLKGEEWAGTPFAAFDTENPENMETEECNTAEKITERLNERKMVQLLPVLKAAVLDMNEPLVEGQITRAQECARELAAKLKEPRRR